MTIEDNELVVTGTVYCDQCEGETVIGGRFLHDIIVDKFATEDAVAVTFPCRITIERFAE